MIIDKVVLSPLVDAVFGNTVLEVSFLGRNCISPSSGIVLRLPVPTPSFPLGVVVRQLLLGVSFRLGVFCCPPNRLISDLGPCLPTLSRYGSWVVNWFGASGTGVLEFPGTCVLEVLGTGVLGSNSMQNFEIVRSKTEFYPSTNNFPYKGLSRQDDTMYPVRTIQSSFGSYDVGPLGSGDRLGFKSPRSGTVVPRYRSRVLPYRLPERARGSVSRTIS